MYVAFIENCFIVVLMQGGDVFPYQIVNKTSIKSANLAQLQQCIKDVIENSDDLQSQQSISSISAFQNCVSAQYKVAANTNSEGYYLNSLFSLLSYDSLQKNNKNYLLLMNSLITTDLGEKKNKAMNISKDIIAIQPDLNPVVWTLLEKILVWLTNPLGTSMHLTLHPLRDTIWKWYFSGDPNSVVSSLSLLNIFFRRFYVLLIPAFNSFQNLLIHSIQDQDVNIRNQAITVLKSALGILGQSSDGPIRRLFDRFRELIEYDYNPLVVESIISVFDHTVDCCSIMQFSQTMIEKLNPNEPSSLLLIPFIYKCRPSIFTTSDVQHILEMFNDFLAQQPTKKVLIYKAVGNFGFQLSKFIIESHQIIVNTLIESIQIDSREAAYAFLSFVDPQSDYFYDKMSDLFQLPINTFLARGMRAFIRRWPDSAHQFRSYVMRELNNVVLTKSDSDKLSRAFSIMSIFTFRDDEMSNQMIDQYALALRHPSPQVREKCANFLIRQQSCFPSAVYRLVAFVSIEMIPELRAEAINKIVVQSTQTDMITPLHSLLSDRQTEIVYKALTLLCEISEASHFMMEFTCDIINRLNRSTTLETHYVTCLLILARNHFIYVRPFTNIIIEYLLKCERQTASSIELISILVNDLDFENIIPKLEPILLKSLNRNSSNRKVSSALKLFTVLLSSQSFRIQLRSTREILVNNLIDLFSSTDSEKIRTQILEVFSRIGVITPLAVRSLFTRPIKRLSNNTIAPLDGLSNLPVYAASFAVSSVTDILASEDFSCLQGLALETLLIILKKFRTIPIVIHDEILETICFVIRSKLTSTTSIILNNVPTLIRIFDKKSEIFIPDIINMIFDNWGKIDTAILLTGIEWMAYKLPDAVSPFATKILSLFVPELSTAKNGKESENIFVAIACFGKLAAKVDTMIMSNVIPWIEGHIHETETEAYVLEKFADILKGLPIEKFYVRIYQMMIMITKENAELIPQVIEILSVLVVHMKYDFEIFIPEILQFYDLKNYDTFWKIIECVSTHVDIPDNLSLKYKTPQLSHMFQDFPEQPFSSFQYLIPDFEVPMNTWDALQWNKWFNNFMNMIILKSPSKAISACYTICERDHKVRSALFPVSFSLCISESQDPSPLHNVLKVALTSDNIPNYIISLFLSSVEILMLHNIDIRVSETIIGEKAMITGNLSLALRCFENNYKLNPDNNKGNQRSNSQSIKDKSKFDLFSLEKKQKKENSDIFLSKIDNSQKGDNFEPKSDKSEKSDIFLSKTQNSSSELFDLGSMKRSNSETFDSLSEKSQNQDLFASSTDLFNIERKNRSNGSGIFDIYSKKRSNSENYPKNKTNNSDISRLIKINLMLGKSYLARKLAKCETAEEAELVCNWEKAYELYSLENNREKQILCLEKLNKFETLESLNIKGEKAADISLFNCSSEFRELAQNDFHKCVLAILDGECQQAQNLIQKIRENVFPHILSNTDFDYSSITNELSSASMLVDLEDAARILELRTSMINSTPNEKLKIQDKIQRLFEMWDEKFDSLDPASLFLTIIIRRSVSPSEKTADGFVKFLRKYHDDKSAGELVDMAFRRLKVLDLNRFNLVDSLLNKSVDEFEQVVINNKYATGDDNVWRHDLGKRFFMEHNYEKSIKYLPRNTLDWAKATFKIYETKKDPNLIIEIIPTFIKFDGLHFIMAVLSRNIPEIENIVQSRIEMIPASQLSDFLPQIISNCDKGVFKSLLYKYFKAYPSKTVFSLVYKILKNEKRDIYDEFLSLDQSIVNILDFCQEMIKISTSYHEKIAILSQKFLESKDPSELISLYNEEKNTGVVKQMYTLNPELNDCKKCMAEYSSTLQKKELENCLSIHKSFLGKLVLPKEYSLSDISDVEEKKYFQKIILPFSETQIGRFASIIAQENYSKTVKAILDSGKTSSFTIRNRSNAFIDERSFILMRMISKIIKSYQKPNLVPPLVQTIPLTENISLEKSSPCFSLEEAIKQRRRRQSVCVDERTWILNDYDDLSAEDKMKAYKQSLSSTRGDDLEAVIVRGSVSYQGWMERRSMYIGSLSVKAVTGYIFGVGDRKLTNIMMELNTSKVYNTKYYPCFVKKQIVPFRLTRIMANALDVAGVNGVLEREMNDAMDIVRESKDFIVCTLEPSIRDEKLNWTSNPENALDFVAKRLSDENDSQELVLKLIDSATSDTNISRMPADWNSWW
ncbi:PIKK family atypical protein kinase [Trichomonas vaginalis G3]|uniref:PIKK family atypical protein kinase n=1 Tax=Trichomonas vaginalis (strain ATCC PRA-98 / G3) TaxID=412133 RepID=A2EPK5_TRIV3|nr:ataxia telangiectasia mutated (ATM) -related family [Trichomonas vaginalis G3]EAY05434.1 PIKK family atypical protein kinase [Trichomonas vaginalis G3]KAI5523876.1 ataxia telangiectasia mutated (ATM) -related family [Trichomonas vaginalis G3]|eukprot:XP_001317657.1 PIKK family atypical protein kinase [Trichomonas vaginalis G3]